MPILRAEITTYVETWNEHRIRPQRQRPNHVPGVPNQLYTDASTPRFGWVPDIEFLAQQVLAEIRNEVDTFGLVEAGVEQEDGESATDQEWNY